MGIGKKWLEDSRVGGGMIMVQVIGTGLQLLSRVILSEGTFIFALMAYRHVVGAFFVLPFALIWERGSIRKLSWSVFFWLFLIALTGISMAMGLFYFGLRDTTATYATNFLNLIPVVTFLFSTILRIEKLGLDTRAGKIKVVGAMLCLSGALVISLYKGKSFHISDHNMLHHSIIRKTKPHWVRGTIFLCCSFLSYGAWFILQAKLFKVFPYKYWATTITCIMATTQQVVMGLSYNSSKAAWRLGWNLQLITIVYSGALATAASFCLITWAIAKRGPTYPSMFNPLSLMFVAVTESIILGEAITIGSLLGMLLIIVGLYFFLWGKNRESKAKSLPKIAAAAGEEIIVPEDAGLESIAMVVPPNSVNNMNQVEDVDKTQVETSKAFVP